MPRPNTSNQYYVFTIDELGGSPPYSTLVTMVGSTPTVATATTNVILPGNPNNSTEGMTVARHCNGNDYWLITHEIGTAVFNAYLISSAGISAPVPSAIGPTPSATANNGYDAAACMKISSNSRKLAFCVRNQSVDLYDFDPSSGTISNLTNVSSGTTNSYYGVEFSANNDILYYTQISNGLYAYEISSGNTSPNLGSLSTGNDDLYGALQMAPDGNIYMARDGTPQGAINQPWVGIITNTNSFSLASYTANGIQLASGTGVKAGLPNIIPSFSVPQLTISGPTTICSGGDAQLTVSGGTTYMWSPSNGLSSNTGSTVIASPTATQTYTVTSIVNGCTISQNFTLTVEDPEISVTGDDLICKGEGAQLTVSGGTTYTWSPSTGLSSTTGSTVTATPTTTQTYTVTSVVNGCTVSENFTVVVENCCQADTDPLFTTITNDITSDTYWDGKIYIPDNTIITVDDVILDITTADVVFGECSGIDFTGDAQLRLNNSVLRSCNPLVPWRGLRFFITATVPPQSVINECTFKNAQRAIHAFGNRVKDISVTNNLFSNCKSGITMDEGDFIRSITGNTFMVDDLVPDFMSGSCSYGNQGEYFGIFFNRLDFHGSISQNDFRAPNDNAFNFTGIESSFGDGLEINSNNFSNSFRSIHLYRTDNAKIESNEINVSNDFVDYEHQIAVVGADNTLVSGNNILNTSHYELTEWAGNNSGIYIEVGRFNEIKENHIEGFETGIHCERANDFNITDNAIDNCYFYGIYHNDTRRSKTSCNTINMEMQEDGNAIGIGYIAPTTSHWNNEILSNCIFESNIAMYFQGTHPNGNSATLPQIRNNYMYNYSDVGIETNNMNGNIGTSSSISGGAGRNSFISNNGLGLTPDIASSHNLTSHGNFNVNIVGGSGTVSINGNDGNSTASCGNQIDTENSSEGNLRFCDNLSDSYVALIDQNNSLIPEFEQAIPTASAEGLVFVLFRLSTEDKADYETFYNVAKTQGNFESNELAWFSYYYYSLKSDNEQALAILNKIAFESTDEQDLIQLELIKLEGSAELSPSQTEILQSMASSDSKYANLSTSILYRHGMVDEREFNSTLMADRMSLGSTVRKINDNTLKVYPNPAEEHIIFEYALLENENAEIIIFDLNGKEIAKFNLAHQASTQSINISDLPSGVYSLSLRSEERTIAYSKLVKL